MKIKDGLEVNVGSMVKYQFGKKTVLGTVLGFQDSPRIMPNITQPICTLRILEVRGEISVYEIYDLDIVVDKFEVLQ